MPYETLSDWANYADAVVSVSVSSITRGELLAEAEGIQPRIVKLAVNGTLWRSSISQRALPRGLELQYGGWVISNDRPSRRLYFPNAVDFAVDGTYVMPIRYDLYPKVGWTMLYPTTIIPSRGGVLGEGEAFVAESARFPAREALVGKSISSASMVLSALKPDPLVVRYAALPPSERYQKVEAVKSGAAD